MNSSEYELSRQDPADFLERVAAVLASGDFERVQLRGHRSFDCGPEPRDIGRARARVVAEQLVALGASPSSVDHDAGDDTRPHPANPQCDPTSLTWHPARVVTIGAFMCEPRR